MSKDAAWTTPLDAEYLKCLPQIGLKVIDHIRVSPDTTFALPHSDRVYMLEHARIVWEGEPAKFAADAGTGYL